MKPRGTFPPLGEGRYPAPQVFHHLEHPIPTSCSPHLAPQPLTTADRFLPQWISLFWIFHTSTVICTLLRPASLTERWVLEVHPHCSLCWDFPPFMIHASSIHPPIIHPLIHLSIQPSTQPSIHASSTHLSIHPSIHPTFYSSFIHPSIHHQSIIYSSSIQPSIYPSNHLPNYASIYPSII